jgi:hypothetical protein
MSYFLDASVLGPHVNQPHSLHDGHSPRITLEPTVYVKNYQLGVSLDA